MIKLIVTKFPLFIFLSSLPDTAKHWLSLAGFSHPKTDNRQKSNTKMEEITKQQHADLKHA